MSADSKQIHNGRAIAESGSVVTRFAPSPSGHLHVGGARTALFCWAYARGRGGRFILRIEDTDRKRSSDTAGLAFLEDLDWLGIDWDEGPQRATEGNPTAEIGGNGPYFQSQRLDIYHKYIEQLVSEGHAYRAFETPEELDAARAKAKAEKRTYRYDRAALALDEQTVEQYIREGRPYVVRLKIPDNPVTIDDVVRGTITTSPEELDDFVILKADGWPTYHFAVVVDDELMGVTHVIRAQEHLTNTPKHVLLQQALGFRVPIYAHVSVVTNPDGSKMSKRDKDKHLRAEIRRRNIEKPPASESSDGLAIRDEEWAWWLAEPDRQLDPETAESLADALTIQLPEINVDDFRRAGYLPEVMVNYLALLGWNPGGDVEKFDCDFLIEQFDLDRVIKSPAKFDRDKLLAFNLDAIQQLSAEEFVSRFRAHAERYHKDFIETLGNRFDLFARANQPRCKTLDDPFQTDRFFIIDDEQIEYEMTKPVRKALSSGPPSGWDHLERVLEILRSIDHWSTEAIEERISEYAEQNAEGKLGKVAQPLRIAVSGGPISPAIFETLTILGRESTLSRIERLLAQRSALTAG